MLRQVSRNLPKEELHKIAKTIQWHYRANQAHNFRKGFRHIERVTDSKESQYKLRQIIGDSLDPSNKFHDPKEAQNILNSKGFYDGHDEYKYITFLAGFKLPSLKTIMSELTILMKEFEGIAFCRDSLIVEMGPFTLEDVEFGNFQVGFPMTYFCLIDNESVPRLYPVTPNYPDGDDLHSHPHVRGNEVCLGNGRKPLYRAMTGARLQDCFEIVRSILNTYNANDPFAHLVKWTGERCRSCDNYYDPENDETACCDRCEKTYCKACVRRCCSASDFACYRCQPARYSCRYCGNSLCSECIKVCELCKQHLCSSHTDRAYHRCV
jgi:hypothetical protein